jgi:hypothetical protein
MASRWLPPSQDAHRLKIHTNTTNFFWMEYIDGVVLNGSDSSKIVNHARDCTVQVVE